MKSPYLIQLYGGHFDGFRQSVNFIPLDDRLEMPGALSNPDRMPSPQRAALYELRTTTIDLSDGLPTMVLNYHFVGMRIGKLAAALARLLEWTNRIKQRRSHVGTGRGEARIPNAASINQPA